MLTQRTKRRLYAGLLICAALGAGGCALNSHRTPEERQADDEIVARVSSALSADKLLYSRHIDIRADKGVVHLGGYVWTDVDLYRAEEIASAVPGVTRVENQLELERQGIDNSPVSR